MVAHMHLCHAVGCERAVPPRYLMCSAHWGMVPHHLQQRVWATYVRGQEVRKDPTPEYLAAARAAINAVAAREIRPLLPPPPQKNSPLDIRGTAW